MLDTLNKILNWLKQRNPFVTYRGVFSSVQFINQNTTIQFGNVMEYEFINLGNQPVWVAGMFLDRYYSGALNSPTIISGSNYKWRPLTKSGELDTGNYTIVFEDTFYSAVTANRRLYVVKKSYSPPQVSAQTNL